MRQDLRIIVEGMDGTGKTYLVDYLRNQFPQLDLVVNKLGPEQNFDVWWPEQLERAKSSKVPIHDRFFYSELVYGPVIRGHIVANPNVVQNVLWFLRTTTLLIYARPPVPVIRRQLGKNKQMAGVESHFQQLLELYDQLMMAERSWYGNRFVHYRSCVDGRGELAAVASVVESYLGAGT
jgi:thymidylate kinase